MTTFITTLIYNSITEIADRVECMARKPAYIHKEKLQYQP